MEDLDRALELARELGGEPAWRALADYYRLRGEGRRKDAMAALETFLRGSGDLPFEARRRLAGRLAEASMGVSDPRVVVPQPLVERFLNPTFEEWAALRAADAAPHLWLGLVHHWSISSDAAPADHFRRALELDPGCRPARERLIRIALDAIDFNQHHLPDDYLGDPREDLAELEDLVGPLIEGLPDGEPRSRFEAWRGVLEARAQEWTRPPAERDAAVLAAHWRSYGYDR